MKERKHYARTLRFLINSLLSLRLMFQCVTLWSSRRHHHQCRIEMIKLSEHDCLFVTQLAACVARDSKMLRNFFDKFTFNGNKRNVNELICPRQIEKYRGNAAVPWNCRWRPTDVLLLLPINCTQKCRWVWLIDRIKLIQTRATVCVTFVVFAKEQMLSSLDYCYHFRCSLLVKFWLYFSCLRSLPVQTSFESIRFVFTRHFGRAMRWQWSSLTYFVWKCCEIFSRFCRRSISESCANDDVVDAKPIIIDGVRRSKRNNLFSILNRRMTPTESLYVYFRRKTVNLGLRSWMNGITSTFVDCLKYRIIWQQTIGKHLGRM